jgi:hypothetical protein
MMAVSRPSSSAPVRMKSTLLEVSGIRYSIATPASSVIPPLTSALFIYCIEFFHDAISLFDVLARINVVNAARIFSSMKFE